MVFAVNFMMATFWIAFLLWCVSAAALGQPPAVVNSQGLIGRFHEILARSESSNSHWGIQIVSLDSGRTWFETNSHRLFVPASSAKLFTAALALNRLGAEFRVQTSFLGQMPPSQEGVLAGDLIVFGRGDPSIRSGDAGAVPKSTLSALAKAILNSGIRRIQGDLVCDTSYFREPPYGPGWDWDDLVEGYAAGATALSLDDSAVRLRIRPGQKPGSAATVALTPSIPTLMALQGTVLTVSTNDRTRIHYTRLPGQTQLRVRGTIGVGSTEWSDEVSVPVPVRYFGERLLIELQKSGVVVEGSVRTVDWLEREDMGDLDATWRELGTYGSDPLGELLPWMLKPSNNVQAQMLWLLCGAETESKNRVPGVLRVVGQTTSDASRKLLAELLTATGIPAGEVQLLEGSGLARANLVTPAAFVQLLRYMNQHHSAQPWHRAFPVGGRDGTLRTRFTQPPAKDNVRAKTGSLRHVHSLCGYVTSADGERFAFAILRNQVLASAGIARAEMDSMVTAIAGTRTRE